jgi:predicted aspartyl protease
MKMSNRLSKFNRIGQLLLVISLAGLSSALFGERAGWWREEVNWRLSGGRQIKAISYPAGKVVPRLDEHRRGRAEVKVREITEEAAWKYAESAGGSVFAGVISGPPLDGFVPWIVVAATDEADAWEFDAYPSDEVVGDYLTVNPEADYAIGILDTGAGTHVIGDDNAVKMGISPGMVTTLEVVLSGATGSAIAYTSEPLGIFIAGLDALDSNGLLVDDSQLMGEYNVSVLVGDPVESANLPTVIGMPMAVYCSAAFCNNKELFVSIDGNDYSGPYIAFYGLSDSSVPSYPNLIDLQLRPSDAYAVQYFPCELLDLCESEPDGTPVYPSMIWGGFSSQSVYFVPWVNLADGGYSISGVDGFMLDTGAQVTVISRTMASGMHLSTSNPEFEVEIQDVTGQITYEPGFYLDSLQMPADGQWLEYTDVPVVVINVDSPEGGYLDGIIGMNLFVDLNFVIKGGGLAGQDGATLEFEFACQIPGDIAGECYQCKVDVEDLAALSDGWLGSDKPRTDNWNPNADLAPQGVSDGKTGFLDFAVLVQHWLESVP